MKKIFDLGNNIKVEFEDDEYKIISANGSIIRLDNEGEILGCDNSIRQKKLEKRKKYLKRFIKIGEEERKEIIDWLDFGLWEEEYKEQKNFFSELEKELGETEYEFYVAVVFNTREKIDLFSDYKKVLPEFEFVRIKSNELNLWVAYNLIKKIWTYEEAFDNLNLNSIEGLYVLKKAE